MKLKIVIELDNDAFKESPWEIVRILREIAAAIEAEGNAAPIQRTVLDTNGNSCGKLTVKD